MLYKTTIFCTEAKPYLDHQPRLTIHCPKFLFALRVCFAEFVIALCFVIAVVGLAASVAELVAEPVEHKMASQMAAAAATAAAELTAHFAAMSSNWELRILKLLEAFPELSPSYFPILLHHLVREKP